MQTRERTVVRYVVSVVALALLVGHYVLPDRRIDAVSLGLVVVGVIPWLGSIFKSLELPGGFKVEYQQFEQVSATLATLEEQRQREVTTIVSGSAAHFQLTASAPSVTAQPPAASYSLSGVKDPRLRLFALRAEIEKRLRELAAQRNIGHLGHGAHLGPPALLGALVEARAISPPLFNSVQVVIEAANQALHGAEVSDRIGDWAAETGPVILRYLAERTLDYAHVRVLPTPLFIDKAGVRQEVAPSGAVGVCQVRFAPNMPEVVTLVVPLNGAYAVEIPMSRVHVTELDETSHGYHLRAEFRLVGLRIVIDPHKTHDGTRIWTEPA
jgi:hypothetical protein